MLKVFDYFIVRENEEAVPCVLITLSVKLSANCSLYSLDFVLVVLLFVNFDAAATKVESLSNPYLPPDSSGFAIFIPDKVQLVN